MDDGIPRTTEQEALPKPKRRKPPESGEAWNDVESVIYTRRSVRLYRDKQVPEYLVQRVLEAGRYAPSAGNGQGWRFIVLRDRALIDEMESFVRSRLNLVSNLVDYTRPKSKAVRFFTEQLMKLRPNDLHPTPLAAFSAIADGKLGVWHGAPTVILILADMRSPGSPMLDAGIAGQNMVLAAHSMGLGTCWVSFAKLLETSRKYKKLLELGHPYRFASSIALGYPRGVPDGFVPRETHESTWFEEGGHKRIVT